MFGKLGIAAIALAVLSLWGAQRLTMPPPSAPAINAITAAQIDKGYRAEAMTKQIHREAQIARELFRRHHYHLNHADLIARYAIAHHIPTRLLAAVIFVESKGNATAVYRGVDVGLMQINTKVWHYTAKQLQDPEFNVQVGTKILGTYIHLYGFVEGLHHYNGMSKASNEYAATVYQIAGMDMPA